VAEYLDGRETGDFGDIAPALALAVKRRLARDLAGRAGPGSRAPDPGHRHRRVPVSPSRSAGPPSTSVTSRCCQRSNLPVLYPRIDLGGAFTPAGVSRAIAGSARRMDLTGGPGPVALGFGWAGIPATRGCAPWPRASWPAGPRPG